MSSTTPSTTSPLTIEAEDITQEVYFISIGSIIINMMIVLWLKMAFEPRLIYRILMVESAVNMVGLLGLFIMWIIAQYPEIPTPYHQILCTVAAALSAIFFFNFFLSNLLIACPR